MHVSDRAYLYRIVGSPSGDNFFPSLAQAAEKGNGFVTFCLLFLFFPWFEDQDAFCILPARGVNAM